MLKTCRTIKEERVPWAEKHMYTRPAYDDGLRNWFGKGGVIIALLMIATNTASAAGSIDVELEAVGPNAVAVPLFLQNMSKAGYSGAQNVLEEDLLVNVVPILAPTTTTVNIIIAAASSSSSEGRALVGTTSTAASSKFTSLAAARSTTITTTRSSACQAGYYDANNNHPPLVVCLVCPPGSWCNGSSVATPCDAGTASAAFGASAACPPCPAETAGSSYSLPGATACSLCPVGYYCPSPSQAPVACPEHTASPQGASAATECQCLSGYTCTYSQVTQLSISLQTNSTLKDLMADTWLISALQQAVAAAAGPSANVTFVGFVAVGQS